MKCHEIQEHLYEYQTGSLDKEICDEVDRHLKDCKTCQAALQELKTTVAILDHAKPSRLSRNFTDKVMARVKSEAIPFHRRTPYKYILQGALAAMVVFAVVTTIRLKSTTEIEPAIRGKGIKTDVSDCSKAIVLYNRGTKSSDLKIKESFFKDALAFNCSDKKVVAKIHNNLADCYENQGRMDEAIEEYKVTIELDDELAYAYLSLGDIYKKQLSFQKAVEYYQKGISLAEIQAQKSILEESELALLKRELEELKARIK